MYASYSAGPVGQVTNSSRIPVIFAVELPNASSGVLRVSPIAGLLLGHQAATLQVIFAPRETKEYQFRLPVKVQFGKPPSVSDLYTGGRYV